VFFPPRFTGVNIFRGGIYAADFSAPLPRIRHAVEERHPGKVGAGEDGFRLSPE